jgi:hypothetical protein
MHQGIYRRKIILMDFNNFRWLCLKWDEGGPRFLTYSEEEHFRYNNKIFLKEINSQKENKDLICIYNFLFIFLIMKKKSISKGGRKLKFFFECHVWKREKNSATPIRI